MNEKVREILVLSLEQARADLSYALKSKATAQQRLEEATKYVDSCYDQIAAIEEVLLDDFTGTTDRY